MSDTPEYILKQPVTRRADTINENYHAVTGLRFPQQRTFWVSKDDWDKLFVPLDIPSIEKQLRDIVEKNHCGKPSSIEWIEAVRQEGLAETAKELLAVFGLEKEESHE